MAVRATPEGYHTVTPYLIVQGAAEAIEYYKKAFGATELFRLPGPDGRLGHAEITIGDSHVMMADEIPEQGIKGPKTLGGAAVSLMVYVDDVDAVFARAIAAGGTELRPIADQFYGDRSGQLGDPFGHVWSIATHVEDVPPEELNRRMAEFSKGSHGGE